MRALAPKLQVILCSTRPGRVGATVAHWARDMAVRHGKFDAELVDLAEVALPIYNEPRHPVLRHTSMTTPSAGAPVWPRADAYVFVLPEYNSGTTPALINAFNYVYREWNYKPAAFVSYGGISGGVRAVQFTKQIMNTLKLVPIVEGVIIPMVAQQLDEERRFKPTESHLNSAKAMLDELLRWAEALKPMRATA